MQQFIQFLSQNWAMSAALIVVFFMILFNEIQFLRKKGKEISPKTAVNLINNENAVVFDLRDAESFKKSHIIDAIHTSNEDFELPKMNKYKEKTLILVCSKGLQSATLATKLHERGFKTPLVLAGGMEAWQSAQLPTLKGK